jgi:hypothetical protein
MNYAKAAAGGVVGGLIGALVWAGIAYAFHAEIGWIAWGVGFLVGVGVRLAAGERDGPGYGLIAILIAALAVVGGKYLAVHWLVASELAKVELRVTDEDMVADEVADEWRAKGKKVDVPARPNPNPAVPDNGPKYTPAVTAEAKKRWAAVPAAERQAKTAAAQAKLDELKAALGGAVRGRGFRESFTPFDGLWLLLAAVTAFRLGSGAKSG